MPTPQQEKIENYLETLLNIQIKGLSQDSQTTYTGRIRQFKKDYQAAVKEAQDKSKIEDQRKLANDCIESINKNLPNFVKGIYTASLAFENGDKISGSAAIMDICSSVVPMIATALSSIASLTSFAGPVGTAFGTLFSLVSQILSFFMPQEPSLKDQIQKMLDHLQSEQQIQTITAVANSIKSYSESLGNKADKLAEILAMELDTEAQADYFYEKIKALEWGLGLDRLTLIVPQFANWEVAAYLEREENQSKEGWPEVLGIWCRTYSNLLATNMKISCIANPFLVNKLKDATAEHTVTPRLPKDAKQLCHKALLDLNALLEAIRDSWASDRKIMKDIWTKLKPAAKERGLYVINGFWDSHNSHEATGNVLLVAVGRKGVLEWKYEKDFSPWLKSFSINTSSDQLDSFVPKYKLLCQDNKGSIESLTLDSVTGTLSNKISLVKSGKRITNIGESTSREFSRCTDMCWLPDPKGSSKFKVYSVHDASWQEGGVLKKICYVNVHEVDGDNKVLRVNWEPHTSLNASHIRAVTPLPPLIDNPDAGALPQGDTEIIYVGYRNSPSIFVAFENYWKDLPSPFSTGYNGIEVDPIYLWVFGSNEIACTTHTSMINCQKGKQEKPNWKLYKLMWDNFSKDSENKKKFDTEAKQQEYIKNRNLLSLCPCADGSLSLSINDMNASQNKEIWTANYSITLEGQIQTDSWVRRKDPKNYGRAARIYKMPIPCWPVFDSLYRHLNE